MFQSLDVFQTAMAMARHAGQKQAYSAQNIANADTPNYHARRLAPFQDLVQSRPGGQKATRDTHLSGYRYALPEAELVRDKRDPNGNTVSLELEMVTAVDAKRQHDRALAIYRSSLSVLRASLGRP